MVKAKFGGEMGYDGYYQVYLDQSAAAPAIGGRWVLLLAPLVPALIAS